MVTAGRIAYGILVACALSGCASERVVVERASVVGTGSAIVIQIQEMSRARCRYYPTPATVLGVLQTAYAPEEIADAICLAVLQRRGDPSIPFVNGVLVRGRFVR